MPNLVDTLITRSQTEREKLVAETPGLDAQAQAILGMLARCADNVQALYEKHGDVGSLEASLFKCWYEGAADAFDRAFLALRQEGLI